MKRIILLSLLVCGCAHGPTQEKKSAGNYLSGEHYRADTAVAGIPVSVERKIKETIIRGQLLAENPLMTIPNRLDIGLFRDDKALAHATSNTSGMFEFKGDFPNGVYTIMLLNADLRGQEEIRIDSYEPEPVEIFVTRVKN